MARNLYAFFVSFSLLAAGTANAQKESFSAHRGMTPEQIQARADSIRARSYPPATAEGLSVTELSEYRGIIERHKSAPDAPFSSYAGLITADEQERLLALFKRMSRQQQLAQNVVFIRPDPPKARRLLGEADFEAFRDSTHFTLLVDFRPLDNSNLARYKASDFAWYEVSPSLMRPAGSAYFTQRVLLQTNTNYQLAQERYEKFKDGYQMVFASNFIRKTRVERPAN